MKEESFFNYNTRLREITKKGIQMQIILSAFDLQKGISQLV